MVLEYYQPLEVMEQPVLNIRGFGHYFRFVHDDRFERASDPCEIDIKCPEGDEWADDMRAVVKLSIPAGGDMSETADKRFLILTLKNGVTYEEKEETNRPKKGAMQPQKPIKHMPLVSGNFETMVLRLDLSSFIFQNNDEEIFKNSFEMMTVAQLDQTIDSLAIQRDSLAIAIQHFQGSNTAQKDVNTPSITSAKNVALDNNAKQQKTLEGMNEELLNRTKFINRHKIEWHRKFTLAFSCIILFFIGAPLGAIIRKGGLGWPTILALGIFILFEMRKT